MLPSHRTALGAVLSLLLLFGCGGGAVMPAFDGNSSTGAFSVTLSAPDLPIYVPPVANQSVNPAPYSGTVTVNVTRAAGNADPVNLSVDQAALPSGVLAQLADTVLAPGVSSTSLSIQAGYATDATFQSYTYPALGTFPVTVHASTSAGGAAATSLALQLVQEPADFGLTFLSADLQSGVSLTNLDLTAASASVTEPIEAYWATGSYSALGPVMLGVQDAPAGLTVTYDQSGSSQASVSLDDSSHTVTFRAQSGLAAGIYSLSLTAYFRGVTHTLPVVVTYSPSPFLVQSFPIQPSATVSVMAGQPLTFPVYLWHDDAYFGTVEPAAGTDPTYVGATNLSVSGAPSGLTVTFGDLDPTSLASVPLQIAATNAVTPGVYPLSLTATRVEAAGSVVATTPVNVQVRTGSGTTWIQNVEWGQGVLAPNLRLVAGKPALLRVQLLADWTGQAAPSPLTATISYGGTSLAPVTLQGPATVPTSILEGDLPTVANPVSGSSYTFVVPGANVQPGMSVLIQGGSLTSLTVTVTPSVDPGFNLRLTAVPVICGGIAPVLPADAVMMRELMAFWPIQGVTVTHRAPYTTATVIPQPGSDPLTDTSSDGWINLLGQIASLRIIDGSSANYYGFFNPGLEPGFTSSIVGLSYLGRGAGIGIDETAAGLFQNEDPSLDLATTVMVHEEGHAFNLNHAPSGGAGDPQLDFPYAGGAIGTWGYDPAALAAYDPALSYDVMGYASDPHWISDWNYMNAMGFMDLNESPSAGLATGAATQSDQWVVSGWIGPDGQTHLLPLVRIHCVPVPPVAGDQTLLLQAEGGTRSISFSAVQAEDMPAGYRHFSFTVPAAGELVSAEWRSPGSQPLRRSRTQSLALRSAAVQSAAQDGGLRVQEAGGVLRLAWDATAHPYVNVFHEGVQRTTLGLHLTGGSAELSLAGLPAGGRFVVHYSDGLNPVARSFGR